MGKSDVLSWFSISLTKTLTILSKLLYASYQSKESERIIQVPGCDDCTGLDHDTNLVNASASVVAALPGAGVSKVSIDSVSNLYQKINI